MGQSRMACAFTSAMPMRRKPKTRSRFTRSLPMAAFRTILTTRTRFRSATPTTTVTIHGSAMLLISLSPSDFEIAWLESLWQTSLAFTLLALVVATALIARRYFEDRTRRQWEARRTELERVLW